MTKLKIAILYGGRSVEHGVSINSARNIHKFIDHEKFEPILIGITQSGVWYRTDQVDKDIEKGSELTLRLNPARPDWISADGRVITADLVFPMLHGTDGEDGAIQGLLKAMGIITVGTGVLGSSVSIDKLMAKKVLREAGLPVADFLFRFFDEAPLSFEEVVQKLGLPFMVKAANLGSSVGVSKVNDKKQFAAALEDSFRYDNCVLFEKFIKAREVECAVYGNTPVEASLPGEVIISDKYEFYSFDAKYVDGDAVTIAVPANLTQKQSDLIRDLSVKAFKALRCEDFARVDLFLAANDEVYVNEINTIPGCTNSSMFPMMWRERGVSFTELITKLISFAQDRHHHAARAERGFASNLNY